MRNSPRANDDLNIFPASLDVPIAAPAPIIVCASSIKSMMCDFSLTSSMMPLMRSSNIPRSIVPATSPPICNWTIWASRSLSGTFSGSSSIIRAKPSTTAVLPTPGSPTSIGEFERSRCERISIICKISFSRPMVGGILSCRANLFKDTPKCLRYEGNSYFLRVRSSSFSILRMRVRAVCATSSAGTPKFCKTSFRRLRSSLEST